MPKTDWDHPTDVIAHQTDRDGYKKVIFGGIQTKNSGEINLFNSCSTKCITDLKQLQCCAESIQQEKLNNGGWLSALIIGFHILEDCIMAATPINPS
jgi:hypothetical protein